MRKVTFLILCVMVAACSSRAPRGQWSDPTLKSSTLQEGVVVGGLVDLTAHLDLFAAQRDAELLQSVITQEHPGVPLVEWSEARATLDPDTLDQVLASYRSNGRLSSPQLTTLAPLAARGRYLALARIDLDHTEWRYPRRSRETIDRTVVDIEPESQRKISLLFDLYDLKLGRLAYTIPMERTGIEHGVTTTIEGIDGVPTEEEIRTAVEDIDSSSSRPVPADREILLRSILREAVKYLP